MDANTSSTIDKPFSRGEKRNVGLRFVSVLIAAFSIYVMTQTGYPPNATHYPSALSWITATSSFALGGSILGFLVTMPACKQKTLCSLTVLSYTIAFFLAIASVITVSFNYFSMYWIVCTGLMIFSTMVGTGAAYAQFRGLATHEELEETVPLASNIPKAGDVV